MHVQVNVLVKRWGKAADEETPFRPRSPYACSKICCHSGRLLITREAYNLFFLVQV